jgi:hypothetical protein
VSGVDNGTGAANSVSSGWLRNELWLVDGGGGSLNGITVAASAGPLRGKTEDGRGGQTEGSGPRPSA